MSQCAHMFFTCILGGVARAHKAQLAISSGRSTYTIKHSIKFTKRSNVEGHQTCSAKTRIACKNLKWMLCVIVYNAVEL